MRTVALPFVIAALNASTASADEPMRERVFQFTQIQTSQSAADIATALKVIADLKDVQVSPGDAPSTLILRGAAEQVALAEWLFVKLDQATHGLQNPAIQEYRLPSGVENEVRVFYTAHAGSVQNLQEIATAVRTIADIRRIVTGNALRVVALRGTAGQMEMAEWLFAQLDKPLNQPVQHSATSTHLIPDSKNEGVMQVFYLANTPTVPDFQGVATLIRTITDIRRLFTYSAPRALALRGTAEQLAVAEWLFNELDKPSGEHPANREYRIPGDREDLVRVLYVNNAQTVQDLQKMATQMNASAHIRRVFTYNRSRAIALRGTADQIATAERIIREADKPN